LVSCAIAAQPRLPARKIARAMRRTDDVFMARPALPKGRFVPPTQSGFFKPKKMTRPRRPGHSIR
jgi:hypothetical protein